MFLTVGLIHVNGYSQLCGGLNIQYQTDIVSTCNHVVMTMIHDELNRPYLYIANKEAGLTVYDISTLSLPTLVATVPVNSLDTLDVMNVSQRGNYLYLATGNSFTNPQKAGMAIVDVTNPIVPTVTDSYVVPGSGSGAGIVKVEGNYAYLGAMKSGLVILDVTNKNNITFVSRFIPDINYPAPNPNPNYYNARGLEVHNSIVYLCYDAGGLRIVNCANKSTPVETGRYANPALYIPFNLPRAYNNIVIDDSLAYIAVDYCGMEVLNISDTNHVVLKGWWNPYNCRGNDWFASPVHANEIRYDKLCGHLFLSTGKSDMYVIDVTNPAQPDSCDAYGGVSNGIGTWGIGLYRDQIYLSYICTLGIPFPSDWTGVKILTYTSCVTGVGEKNEPPLNNALGQNYPNPFNPVTVIRYRLLAESKVTLKIYNILGQHIATLIDEVQEPGEQSVQWQAFGTPSGVYFYTLRAGDFVDSKKLLVLH
jgi:hypothetical protein